MEGILGYFETIPTHHRTLILVGGLLVFWILEGLLPLRRLVYSKFKHAGVNIFFTLTTLIVNLAFAYAIVRGSDWTQAQQFGIIQWIAAPLWLEILVGLLLLDFIGAYLIHWIEHRIYWLWKFHIIHHSDEHVDTTTALRHHPGESVFRATFTLLGVLVVGAPMGLVMLYQSLSAVFSQFNHSNLRLPRQIDRVASMVFVTPRMHRVHHHFEQPYTDCNLGNIFSIWDRVLGTFAVLNEDKIVYGLDVFNKRAGHIGELLKLPVDGADYHRPNRE